MPRQQLLIITTFQRTDADSSFFHFRIIIYIAAFGIKYFSLVSYCRPDSFE